MMQNMEWSDLMFGICSVNEKSTHELNSQVLDFLCVSAGIRTLDPLIKSNLNTVLYRLSIIPNHFE